MLEQALRPLRRVRAQGHLGIRGTPREERAEALQVMPELPRGVLSAARKAPVRLQRMREGTQVRAQEELRRPRDEGRSEEVKEALFREP